MDMTSNIVVDDVGELASILIDGSDHFGVSTVLFDSHEELIWVGNEGVGGNHCVLYCALVRAYEFGIWALVSMFLSPDVWFVDVGTR